MQGPEIAMIPPDPNMIIAQIVPIFGMLTGVIISGFVVLGPVGRAIGDVVRHLFGAERFTIDPYQLGAGNKEGLKSGAWWFYYKLGFRPRDAEVKRVLAGELRAMKRDPKHRSTSSTLKKLSAQALSKQSPLRDMLGIMPWAWSNR